MSYLTQHKTKEELSDWLMNNASDNETIGFLEMLAGDIWGMMNAESEDIKKLKEYQRKYENKIFCLEQRTAVANHKLEKENKKLEEENKKLQEENKKLKEWSLSPEMIEDTSAETIEEFESDIRDNWTEIRELQEYKKQLQINYFTRGDIVKGLVEENKRLKEREYKMCQIANANGWDIYPTDSEEESESDEEEEE